MRQFEIWWASLPLPAGRRPVLLLSRNGSYSYLTKITAAEVTLGRNEGLSTPCVATMDNIRPVPVAALTEKIGELSASRHRIVKRALGHAFDWDELRRL
jgi:mRNA-degrading endonuclease toxin of MazEF toxin-antitoxin module